MSKSKEKESTKAEQKNPPQRAGAGILKNKWYLYLTEFFDGMAVMAVELGASRLVAPYFSSSQIVWTIIIGIIMIAMALGNVFGGKWADKDNDPSKLFRRIIIAAIWIALIPFAGKYIIVGITGILIITVNTNLLIWAAFLACLIIFVFPLFLLGTVTPSLIRYTVSDLKESGSVAGRLGACNTIGSIIGTFIPTFVTIPAVGTSMTFLIFSGILLLLGIMYFVSNGGGKKTVAVGTSAFILGCVLGHRSNFAFWETSLTYEGESIYNYLQVNDSERETALSTNVMFGVQSVKMKTDGLTNMYYDYALAAPLMAGKKQPKILILGMGTGTYATQCQKYFKGSDITGVEIDEKITDLAHEYFELDENIPVYTYDGRAFLNAVDDKYDVIMVDAYQDITIPFQMSSVEFFTLVKEHLNENGVMVMNMNMHGSDGEEDITTYLSDTVKSVFPEVYTSNVPWSTNRELFAGGVEGKTLMLESFNSEMEEYRKKSAEGEEYAGELYNLMLNVQAGLTGYVSKGYLFTDDKAPVELLGMNVIDGLIQGELGYYKDIFMEDGIKGLLREIQ